MTTTQLWHGIWGHRPAYRLYRTAAEYTLEAEREDMKKLMALTDFARLPVEKQLAIRDILED